MAVLVLLITTFLVYFAYGYNVTRTGELDQRGLIFVSSQPGGAEIYVDEKRVGTTGARLVVSAGQRDLRLAREGYHDWSRRITVEGSSVHHFTYPLLVPRELVTHSVKTYDSAIGMLTQSPDQRWVITQLSGTDTLEFVDLNRNQDTVGQSQRIALPDGLVTPGGNIAWRAVDWSTNNRHTLFLRTFTDAAGAQQQEYVLVDRQRPEGSYNLTSRLQLNADVVLSLRDKKPDSYYLYNQASLQLRTATLEGTGSELLVENVLSFTAHGADRVLYATPHATDAGSVDVVLKEGDAAYTLRTIPKGETYFLNLAQYDGSWLIVFGSSAEERTYLYKNPVAELRRNSGKRSAPTFIFRISGVTSTTFSANTRFIAVQNGKDVQVYDAEESGSYRFALTHPLDAPQLFATWMDGYRLSYVSGGKQYIVDFDNTNERELANASSTFLPAFPGSYRFVYNIVNNEQGAAVLRSTALRTPNDL